MLELRIGDHHRCGHPGAVTMRESRPEVLEHPDSIERQIARCREGLRETVCQYCWLKDAWCWVGAEQLYPEKAEAEYAAKQIDERLAALGCTLERVRPHGEEPWALYVVNGTGEEVTSGNCFKMIEWWLIKQERGVDLNLIFPVAEREA